MISRLFSSSRRRFDSLTDQEILALAISAEEDDARIYKSYAEGLREDYPASAEVFDHMAEEENLHRQSLIDLFQQRFGDSIPLIRRDHVQGYYERKPDWLVRPLNLQKTRAQAEDMARRLLGDLAIAESEHQQQAVRLEEQLLTEDVRETEDGDEKRRFLLTYVQPGLAGLMDGSISTLAPIFAAAFATGDTWKTFLVGLSASVGAGISMGFTEAAHDDGVLSGRGSPVKRGLSSGIMTTIGGLGHTLPYLIPDFKIATGVAIAIVFVELWAITWIQNRYMETPWGRAAFQVLLGGALVFAAGIIIGNA